MTKHRDPDKLIAAYLADGMEVLPDRVADAVLDEVHRTRQRAVFGPWRTRSMFKTVLGAAAVFAALVFGGTFFLGQRAQPAVVGGPSQTPGASATATAPASPGPTEALVVVPAGAASWTATGSMVTPREGHTATLLPDGKVLVAGGLNRTSGNPNGTNLASAELYDPATGTWSATGSMGTARESHTATLLADGKVLVAGGSGKCASCASLTSAELYDPATGTWTATGNMTAPRGGAVAARLPNGKVLVAGGRNADGPWLDSAALYDPASGTWTATGTMVYAGGGTATLLPAGKVLVAGGAWITGSFGGGGYSAATAELYDPASGTWTATGNMAAGRAASTATLLPGGHILVAGGCDYAGRASELYDPTTGSWTATGTMVADHCRDTTTMLPDGKVTATLFADGKVLVAGGGPETMPAAELYDPGTGTWAATAKMVAVRVNHTATLLPDGKVLIAGGGDWAGLVSSAELYDPGTGQ